MTVTTKQKITRELARLRMWQQDGDSPELSRATELAHDEINRLLDQLDVERERSKAMSQ